MWTRVGGSGRRAHADLEVIIRLPVAGVAADERRRVHHPRVDRAGDRPLGLTRTDVILVLVPDLRGAELGAERRVLGRAGGIELGRRVLVLRELRVDDQVEVWVHAIGPGLPAEQPLLCHPPAVAAVAVGGCGRAAAGGAQCPR